MMNDANAQKNLERLSEEIARKLYGSKKARYCQKKSGSYGKLTTNEISQLDGWRHFLTWDVAEKSVGTFIIGLPTLIKHGPSPHDSVKIVELCNQDIRLFAQALIAAPYSAHQIGIATKIASILADLIAQHFCNRQNFRHLTLFIANDQSYSVKREKNRLVITQTKAT